MCTPWSYTCVVEVELHSFLASSLDGHELSPSCPGCFTPHPLGQHTCCPLNGKLGGPQFRGRPACSLDSMQTVLSQVQLKVWVINKVTPLTCLFRHRGEKQVQLLSIHNLPLEGAAWSAPHPGHFAPRKDMIPIVQKSGWPLGPVLTAWKILPPPGF